MIGLKLYFCATALFLCSAVISSVSSQDSELEYESSDWDILKLIHKTKPENVVYSPFSLKLLLALLYEGANIDTPTYRSFHNSEFKFEEDVTKLRAKYSNITEQLRKLKTSDLYDFDINSKIFLNSNYKLGTKYNERINKNYDTQSENTNFTDSEVAASTINEWISSTTQGKLTHLVKADEINEAVMLLLNTMIFKGKWEDPFNKSESRQGGFYLNKENTVNVEYMERSGQYDYFEHPTLDAKFLKIPYVGGDLSMTILLPNSKSGLNKLIALVNPRDLTTVKYYLDKEHVHVILPKFNFQSKMKFNDILKSMGLRKIFDGSAQFGRILDAESSSQGVFVSGIVQKTGIEVNEEGSEAYTATGVELSNKFGVPEYIFNASNPFIFFIEHEKTNTVLFIGKVANPSGEKALPDSLSNVQDSKVPNSNVKDSTSQLTANRWGAPTVPPPSISMNLNPTYNQEQSSNNLFHVFDMEMMKKLDRRNNGNILVSPLSIKQVLAMVLEGAEGDSAHELTVAINSLVRDKHEIKFLFQNMLNQLRQKQDGVEFENANRIFVSDKVRPYEQYKKILQQYYQSDIRPIKFSEPLQASHEINQWVNEVTNGLIPSLINPSSIKASTSIILANALYFKGVWEKSFNRESTNRACFYQTTKAKDCNYFTNMMDTNAFYNYAEWKMSDLEVKALEIPYKDNTFSMLILLPTQHDLFSRMVNNLAFIYPDILKKLSQTEVRAFVPRFSIDFSDDILRILEEMDIRGIFDQTRSELTRMIVNDTSHYVSNVFHKARIEVNEEGTIAAAATGFVVIPLMGTSKPVFRADHPFIFFIRHMPTGAILFAGRVKEPERAEEKIEEYPANTFFKPKPAVQKPHEERIQISKTGNTQKVVQIEINNKKVYPYTQNEQENQGQIVFTQKETEQAYNTQVPEATRRNVPQTFGRNNNNEQTQVSYPAYQQQSQVYQQQSSAHQQPSQVYQQKSPVHQQPSPVHQQSSPVYQQPSPVYQQSSPVYTPSREEQTRLEEAARQTAYQQEYRQQYQNSQLRQSFNSNFK